ncbi:Disintegrin and metalloproteinase domain-containing protein 20 [Varanus komodoensis]|nr:Disintegrin and metalloproteinase domain-containing protein 20 [Varanus komodoensis]
MAAQKLPLGFKYASYEVTIPRRLTPKYGQEENWDVNYLLQIEGKAHIVHLMQKKGFVPKHFPVFSYSKNGDLQLDYPFIRGDCFYNGFLQGKRHSLVTLSMCSGGLRGLLQFENKTYEIEPVQPSATFQHVVYQLEREEGAVGTMCGVTEQEQSRQGAMIQTRGNFAAKVSKGEWWTHSRYADIAIVVEHQRYLMFHKNETLVAMHALEIVHIANTFYKPLGVIVSLVGLEIWSEKNLIEVPNKISPLLNTFNSWRTKTLNKYLPNDAGHLFVHRIFGQTAGLAYTGTICSSQWASAVESYVRFSVSFFSVLFAHELGHNLGMNHDGIYCQCERESCIMAEAPSEVDKFSNCSYNDYSKLRNSNCLLVQSDPEKRFRLKYCGNKILEAGEQCDCGTKSQCKSDPCCQSDCKLRPGAVCNIGLCCAMCKYRSTGSICRKKTGNCDLPEYCNGTSQWCPEDVYVQDGAPCSDGAHCYHGKCATLSRQCKMIFGKEATVASESCFRLLNAQGDRFGNCGIRRGRYAKCKQKNIFCGRIQCARVQALPSLTEDSTIIQTSIGKQKCWGTDYHLGMEGADVGAVNDGTPCGTQGMCIQGTCRNMSFLKYDCSPTKCHNRGMCNSRKHCHCDYGWAPPDCLSKGFGGSIDSGPPPPKRIGFLAAIILGTLFLMTASVYLAIHYRTALRQQFRSISSRIYPAESVEVGNPQ